MKLFLYKTISLVLVPILFYLSIGIVLKSKYRDKLEKNTIFILGDSQTKFIKIPGIFNYSVYGSPYYLHYESVNEFINEIAGKKVYIAINYHSLSKIYQNRLVNDPNWRADTFRSMNEYKLINEKYPEIGGEEYEHNFLDIKKKCCAVPCITLL